jgi:hypothetical protein
MSTGVRDTVLKHSDRLLYRANRGNHWAIWHPIYRFSELTKASEAAVHSSVHRELRETKSPADVAVALRRQDSLRLDLQLRLFVDHIARKNKPIIPVSIEDPTAVPPPDPLLSA